LADTSFFDSPENPWSEGQSAATAQSAVFSNTPAVVNINNNNNNNGKGKNNGFDDFFGDFQVKKKFSPLLLE
jgi:hypothetical protein